MGLISIEGMEFFAYHGCFKEEQLIGTRFQVDLYLETDTGKAEYSDDLADTVDYQAIFGLVAEEMKVNSKLLEHVARHILNRIKNEYPRVDSARIKISKLNPPVGGKVDKVSVEINSH